MKKKKRNNKLHKMTSFILQIKWEVSDEKKKKSHTEWSSAHTYTKMPQQQAHIEQKRYDCE